MTATDTVVRTQVSVAVPVATTFRIFTEGIDRWWCREHHIGTAELDEVVLEPRQAAGGSRSASTAPHASGAGSCTERFGDARESMRAGCDSEGGWQGLLNAFADHAD